LGVIRRQNFRRGASSAIVYGANIDGDERERALTSTVGRSTDDRMRLLREVELFRGVADEGLASIAAKVTEISVPVR